VKGINGKQKLATDIADKKIGAKFFAYFKVWIMDTV
jgi:hypothetical protein